MYPKPPVPYSALIVMALRNSLTGQLPVSEIYKFLLDHFPYFKTAPPGWKNSVRHNLSLNRGFEKREKEGAPALPSDRLKKGYLWSFDQSSKVIKMQKELEKWVGKKSPSLFQRSMSDPGRSELRAHSHSWS